MFYRIITGNSALTVLIIVILCLVNWMPAFISHDAIPVYPADSAMPLYLLLCEAFEDHQWTSEIFAFLLVLLIGLILVRINAKFILVQQRTFLPALFFVLLSGFLPENLKLSDTLVASIFLVFTLSTLMRSYKADPNSFTFFNAGLLLGLGSLFYAPLMYFLVFVWISTAFLRSFYWREYIFPILGLLIPFVFYIAWMFISDLNVLDFAEYLKESLYSGFPTLKIDLPHKVFGGYVILLILMASVYMLKVFQFRKIYIRTFFLVLFWFFVTSVAVFILLSGFNTGLIYFITIPVTYLLTNYYCNSRKSWENKVLLYLLILGGIFLSVSRQAGWF